MKIQLQATPSGSEHLNIIWSLCCRIPELWFIASIHLTLETLNGQYGMWEWNNEWCVCSVVLIVTCQRWSSCLWPMCAVFWLFTVLPAVHYWVFKWLKWVLGGFRTILWSSLFQVPMTFPAQTLLAVPRCCVGRKFKKRSNMLNSLHHLMLLRSAQKIQKLIWTRDHVVHASSKYYYTKLMRFKIVFLLTLRFGSSQHLHRFHWRHSFVACKQSLLLSI